MNSLNRLKISGMIISDEFRGLPFEVRIPNEETRKVLQESDQGKNLVHYDSLDDVFEDLGI